MNKLYYLIISICFSILTFSCSSCSDNDKKEKNVDVTYPVPLGDPFIMLHDDTYYAYGTNAEDGIEVYTSHDLLIWEKHPTLALHKDNSWADRWFWAPEVYYIKEKNKFYMYYSADEHICVATADSPTGPFLQDEKEPMIADEKCIDNSLFIDEDGTPYLYFDRFNDGLNIWVAQLENDLKTIKTETLVKCINVSQEWEEVFPRVNEGAFITKYKEKYYLTYSGNSYESQFYGVGFATADSPIGPWVKYKQNPILQKPEDLVGVGHSAMFKDKEGNLKIVFHAHHSTSSIHPRAMYIMDVKFTDTANPVMEATGNILRPKLK